MDSKSFVKVMRKLISEEVRKAVRAEMRILLKEQAIDHKKSMKHGMDMYQEPRTPKPVPGKKDVSFTKDSILNDLLNETAQGSTNTQTAQSPVSLAQPFATGAPLPMETAGMPPSVAEAVTRDYSGLMKAINKKK